MNKPSGDLVKFFEAKREEIEALTANPPAGRLPGPVPSVRPDFLASLKNGRQTRGLGLIAEYKRASPSLGDIDLTLEPLGAARAYRAADAISVLTEEKYFKGHLSYLEIMAEAEIPLLRKDFIFHPLQIVQTSITMASAVLLIVRLTPEAGLLQELISLASSFGLRAVVEIFEPDELKLARQAGAEIIQVNRRDLKTLKIDPDRSAEIIKKYPPLDNEFWIAASGLSKPEELVRVRDLGFGAVLVGTALMKSGQPQEALRKLTQDMAVH
ncbi:MAG: indole-3-glycerol-phosphate synthase [Deltaproteobacteria bacterium]|jgi:indole-3-glycerol phosphate synthase|nr:indole-3-glycerol-phosphate synthase [Deltaproteobacteria bacterium]